MSKSIGTPRQQRRPIGYISSSNISSLHLRTPGVVAWWSAALPGFGHIMLGSYIKGLALVFWEFFVNIKSNLNLAIFYTFIGKFEEAKLTLDKRWAIMYLVVYVYAIWDSGSRTTCLNKYFILSHREKSPIIPFVITSLDTNYLDKQHPWVSLSWSLILPGLGHFHIRRIFTSFLLGLSWIVCVYYSKALDSIYYTLNGNFYLARSIVNYQWIMFLPSIYGFAVYDSYLMTVEYNKLFKYEQMDFLKDNYQDPNFVMPL